MAKHLRKLLGGVFVIAMLCNTQSVLAGGDNNYYINSNVYGYEPWGSSSNIDAMNTVFGAGGWFQEYFETVDVAAVFSVNTNFIFLEGSDFMADELENFLTTNMDAIEDWVNSGGRLFLNAAPNEGDGMSFGFGDVYLTYWGGSGDVTAQDPTHPIFNGPYTPVGTHWTGSSFSHASVSGADLTPLIADTFTPSTVAFSEGRYGTDGIVGFGGMTTNNFHSPYTEAANLRANIIYYLAYYEIPDHDLASLVAVTPQSGCGLGNEEVTITFKNYGLSSESGIPVKYQVDGGTIVSEMIAGPIDPGESIDYTFSSPADLGALGTHTLMAWCELATDEIPTNDTLTVTIESVPTVNTFPYYEEFEGGTGGWVAGGASSTWQLIEPTGFAIYGAPPATPGSLKSWTTEGDFGYYNLNEKSYVISPCFDFSSLVIPYLEMDINWDTQMYSDGAKMQYTTDGGLTWNDLGNVGEGENWYNSYNVYAMWPTYYIFDYRGWDGNSGGWKHAYLDLSFLAGTPSVRLRIVFASDSYWNYNDGFAFDNIKIADPFPNDIGVVAFDAPESGPSLTAAEPVTVVIENFGTLSQSDFPVSYQVDGGTIHTEIFTGTVDPGTTALYTFTTTEDLSVDGDYTFYAYTSLGTDEDVTNDDYTEVISNLLPITGTGAYYMYSNWTGYEPFYATSNTTHMDDVFGVGEWTRDYYETCDPLSVFSTSTCFVYMEGSADHQIEMENFFNTNKTLIQNWVASGGHLFMNAAPYEGDGMNMGFDDTYLNVYWYSYQVEASDPSHPIWSGAFTPVSTSMTGFNYGYASISGDGLTNILYDYYTPDRIICAEKSWGAGDVIFGGMTITDWHSPYTEAGNFKKNLLAYLATCVISDNDMGVTAVVAPVSSCGLTSDEEIVVKAKNYGFLAQTNVPVSYQVDGGPIVTEIIPGTIGVGETVTYTFSDTYDFGATGDYSLVTWTDLATDTIYENDTTYAMISSVPTITTYPYYETFEDGTSGWTTGGSGSTWQLIEPAGFAIYGAPPATPGSVKSWTTEGEFGYYNINEKSYIQSPCMDFTSLVLPYIEFDLNYDTQMYSDGSKVQYTLDDGLTWNDLGTVGEGENWYNNYTVYAMWPTFYISDYRGWDGNSGGWKHAYLDISFLAGQPSVRFRFVMASDSYWNYNDGIAFDNIRVADPFPNDVGVVDVVSPTSDVDLTATEIVSVLIENFGTLAQSNFPVSYSFDGGPTVTELFTGTVDPGSTAVMTFSTTEDLSADGSYEICSWTELATDEDNLNDTLIPCKTIINLLPVTGSDVYYIYSNVYGGYEPWYVTSNSDAMNEVFGAGLWNLEYFETLNVFDVFDENTCFVYMEGSDAQAIELENFLSGNGDFVENWVASGGNLLLNSAPNEGDGMDFGFGGVDLDYAWYTGNVTAFDATHPIFNGPYTPITTDYYGSSFGHATVNGGDIQPIIIDYYDASRYVLAEKNWGSGHVLFGGMTPPYFHTPTEEANNLLKNIYDYIKLCAPVDLGVTEIITPLSGCGLGIETVSVTVENFGPSTVTSFPIKYTVDGGPEVSVFATLEIAPGGTATYTFDVTYDFTEPGTYELCVWTDISGDEDETNDMICVTITSLETPSIEFGPNMTVCDEVTLDAGNTGSTYLWSTGETTQTISVTESGTYSVTITNPTTGCTATDNVTVTVNYTPDASFTYTSTGLTVIFTNTSTDGASYSWSFGDGTTSTEADPSHTYAVGGAYTVTVTVTNGCGSDFYSVVIEVGLGVNDIDLANAVTIYPNPTSDVASVDINMGTATEISLELVNTLGEKVWSAVPGMVTSASLSIDVRNLAAGVYQLNIVSGDRTAAKQIVVTK